MPNKDILELINKYLFALKENDIILSKAILFGSHARNEANINSDIDLLIISSLFQDESLEHIGKIWRLTKVVDYKIEPIAISEKRFYEDTTSPLIELARTEGIEIPIYS